MVDKSVRDPFFKSDQDWVDDKAIPNFSEDADSDNKAEQVATAKAKKIKRRTSIRRGIFSTFYTMLGIYILMALISIYGFYQLNNTMKQIVEVRKIEREATIAIETQINELSRQFNETDAVYLQQFETIENILLQFEVDSLYAQEIANLDTTYREIRLHLQDLGLIMQRYEGIASDSDLYNQTTEQIVYAEQFSNLGLIVISVALALAVLLVALALHILLDRNLLKRIAVLHQVIVDISKGNMEQSIPVTGNDEISDLAKSIEVMRTSTKEVEQLRVEQTVLEEHSRERRRSSMLFLAESFESSIKSIADKLSQAAEIMRNSSDSMRTSTDTNRQQAEEVYEVISASTESVESVAGSIRDITDRTSQVGNQVHQSTSAATNAVQKAQQATRTVQSLSETVQRIGEFVIIIKNIADQTNLLALNASIEAARAGEAGKGFAVVAGEVKNLASQAANATEEITQQIDTVQKATAETVDVIGDIANVITDISNFAQAVNEVFDEQIQQMNNISKTTTQLTDNSSLVAQRVGHIVKASEETDKNAENVVGSASSLSESVGLLNNEVERFLVSIREDHERL